MQLSLSKALPMLIEDWPTTNVRPYPNNPRVLRNAAEKVAESIKAFGWRQPIVVDADGVIIAGHSRHAAAKLLKLKTVPVHIAKDLTPEQVRALRVADNKTATFSEWDDAKLAEELAEIMEGMGAVTITGFSQSEFDAIEMQARAAMEQFNGPANPPAQQEPAKPLPAGDETGDDAPDAPTGDHLPDAGDAGPAASSPPDLVPFSAVMTAENRQVVYEAVTKAEPAWVLDTPDAADWPKAKELADAWLAEHKYDTRFIHGAD
jgi:hypothetical protein